MCSAEGRAAFGVRERMTHARNREVLNVLDVSMLCYEVHVSMMRCDAYVRFNDAL